MEEIRHGGGVRQSAAQEYPVILCPIRNRHHQEAEVLVGEVRHLRWQLASETATVTVPSGIVSSYDLLNREDLDWRRLHQEVALKAIRVLKASDSPKALVLDDLIKLRHGRKMPGVSSHFDPATGRHVMGQQAPTLGLSSDEGVEPLDSELFISATKAQGLHQPFRDGRSIVAKRYRIADQQTKLQMGHAMIRRVLRAGIKADYLLADAWFGNKTTLRMAEASLLPAVLRMKKDAMKYRYAEFRQGQTIYREVDVKA